jgi:hypothetical protein
MLRSFSHQGGYSQQVLPMAHMHRCLIRSLLTAALLALLPHGVVSQPSQQTGKAAPKGAAALPATATSSQVAMPDAEKIILLLRTTLLTLNDAIQTGNFTVLRDRGAPGFREGNSAALLSAAFADLSRRGIDLSAVSVIVPQLTEAPTLSPADATLRLKGFFPGQPVRIDFEVHYQVVEGRWHVLRLSVQPTDVTVNAAKGAASAPPAPAAKP